MANKARISLPRPPFADIARKPFTVGKTQIGATLRLSDAQLGAGLAPAAGRRQDRMHACSRQID